MRHNKPKHEIICFMLLITAIFLFVYSFLLGDCSSVAGILQGIATGIISGTLLLLVSGIKNREKLVLKKNIKLLEDLCTAVSSISKHLGENYKSVWSTGRLKTLVFDDITVHSATIETLLVKEKMDSALGDFFKEVVDYHNRLNDVVLKYIEYIPGKYQLLDADVQELWEIDKQTLDVYRSLLVRKAEIQNRVFDIDFSLI